MSSSKLHDRLEACSRSGQSILDLSALNSAVEEESYGDTNWITDALSSRSSTLKELDVSKNKLSRMCNMHKLLNLEKFIISRNLLTSLSSCGLRLLSCLKYLDISSNSLTHLPDDVCQLANLEILLANRNDISIIPTALERLVQLKKLDLAYNKIISVGDALDGLPKLEEVFLEGNPLIIESSYTRVQLLVEKRKATLSKAQRRHLIRRALDVRQSVARRVREDLLPMPK